MAARRPKRNPEREARIAHEIIVNCYDRHKRALGWYDYLLDQMHLPFAATCITKRAVSPLSIGDEVEVLGLAPEAECECEPFVVMRWNRPEGLAVPLAQLRPIAATDEPTRQAVADWHYWVSRGYEY
jgi:hypothetical protein